MNLLIIMAWINYLVHRIILLIIEWGPECQMQLIHQKMNREMYNSTAQPIVPTNGIAFWETQWMGRFQLLWPWPGDGQIVKGNTHWISEQTRFHWEVQKFGMGCNGSEIRKLEHLDYLRTLDIQQHLNKLSWIWCFRALFKVVQCFNTARVLENTFLIDLAIGET